MKTVLQQIIALLLLTHFVPLSAQDGGLSTAQAEIERLAEAEQYLPSDVANLLVTDDYVSGGIRHIYFQQSVDDVHHAVPVVVD